MMTRAAFFTVFVRTPLQSKSHAGISLRGPWLVVSLYHGASKASATVARTPATSLAFPGPDALHGYVRFVPLP